MTKENKNPQLEQEKREDWEILKARLGIEEPTRPIVTAKKRVWSFKRIAAVCASVLVVAGLSVGAGFYLSSLQTEEPQDELRYCAQSEYTPNEVTKTLKEYSLETGGKILYFDWYEQMENLYDFTFTLNTSAEIIAFKEKFLNAEYGYDIIISVTNNLTELEEFDNYKISCTTETVLHEITIKYGFNKTKGSMMWEYDGYKYYMDVMGVFSAEEMFGLLNELLPA